MDDDPGDGCPPGCGCHSGTGWLPVFGCGYGCCACPRRIDLPQTLKAAAACARVVAAADQLAACQADPDVPAAWLASAGAGLADACADVLMPCLTCAGIPLSAGLLGQAVAVALADRPRPA